jgi:hypothetical protein
MKRSGYLPIAFLILMGLGGCSYETRETTIHEPGVYKGGKDPLLAAPHRQELVDRFRLVQTDR